jgi:hypothetical protein
MTYKTVFRIEKIKTIHELKNKSFHCYDYTDKEIKNFNKYKKDDFNKPFHNLIGNNNNNPYEDIKNLKEKYKISERANSIKCFQGILSLSNEWFKDEKSFDKKKTQDFINRSLKFLKEEIGEDQIAHAVLHLHEETPHIHFFFVPFEASCMKGKYIDLDNDGNKIYHNKLISRNYNRDKLSQLQNKYYECFKDLGFSPVEKKIYKGNDRKELKDHYLEKIEESTNDKNTIESLKIENKILKKENELTTEKLSKLTGALKMVMKFLKIKSFKDLISKVKNKNMPVIENKQVIKESFEMPIYVEKSEEFEMPYFEKQKLTPTPEKPKKKSKGLSRGLRR